MPTQKQLQFSTGLTTLMKGFKEIFSDFKVFVYSIIPVVISAIVIFFLFSYGWDLTGKWVETYIQSYLPDFMASISWVNKTIYWLFNILLKFIMILFLTYFCFVLIQLVSIPFYSLICERILFKRKVFPNRPFRIMTWFRLTLRMFYISIIRMLMFFIIWIFVFIFSLVPGLQFLGILYSALIIAFDGMDYTLEIYEMSLGRRMKFYFSKFSYFAGMSLTLLPALFIPGLILLLLPLTVVGMCVQFAEIEGKEEYEKLIA